MIPVAIASAAWRPRGNGGNLNQLVFTAGLNGEKDGLFGTLTPS